MLPLWPGSHVVVRQSCLLALIVAITALGEERPALRACRDNVDMALRREIASIPIGKSLRSVHAGLAAGIARAAWASSGRLWSLRLSLETVSADPKELKFQFERLSVADAKVAEAVGLLKSAKIRIRFDSFRRGGDCGQGGGLYYPPPRDEIVLCAGGGGVLGEIGDTFLHETIHAVQYHPQKFPVSTLKRAFTFRLPGRRCFEATRALDYTTQSRTLKTYLDAATRQRKWADGLSRETRRSFDAMAAGLEGLETLFFITPNIQGRNLLLTPKKPAGVSDKEFYSDLNRKIPVGKTEGKALLLAMSPTLFQWATGQKRSWRSAEELVKAYALAVSRQYANLRKLAASRTETVTVDALMREYYVTANRIIPHLVRYCTETQANIHTAWRRYLRSREWQRFPACRPLYAGTWTLPNPEMAPKRDIFSPDYRYHAEPATTDFAIEQYVRDEVVASPRTLYGREFSFLYGMKAFPELFSARACGSFHKEIPSAP